MARRYTRDEVEARLRTTISAGSPIIVAVPETGFSAKLAELGASTYRHLQ